MAYDVNKLVKLQGLKDLATQVKSELSALSTRIDDIVSTGGEPNVITSVKVNGTALAIAEKAVDILVATGKANGTLAVNGVDVAVKGLAALAYKAQVSQADLDAALQAVLGSVTTLVGSDAGKSARTIANEELAAYNAVMDPAVRDESGDIVDFHIQPFSYFFSSYYKNVRNICSV